MIGQDLGDDVAGEVTPNAALGTRVAHFDDLDGTDLEIIHPESGFAG
ncbi:hypothetical protein ACFVVA_40010 [Kitasatospora sp. NPDC058048]